MPNVLIIVDAQKGFVTACSSHVLPKLEKLQHTFEQVVFTKFYNPDPSPFRKILDYQKLAPGDIDTALALVPREDAGSPDRVWQSKNSTSKIPAFQLPQLATLTDTMPQGKDWVHEIKFDGYRGLAYIHQGDVTIYTRTGQDWTHKFRPLATKLAKLRSRPPFSMAKSSRWIKKA